MKDAQIPWPKAKSNDIYRPTDSDDRVATATNEGCESGLTELGRNNAPAMTAPVRGDVSHVVGQ